MLEGKRLKMSDFFYFIMETPYGVDLHTLLISYICKLRKCQKKTSECLIGEIPNLS